MTAGGVLVVCADDGVRDALRRDLAEAGHHVAGATDLQAALAAAEHAVPAIAFADAALAGSLAEQLEDAVVIAIGAPREPLPEGAHDVLRIPHDRAELAARCDAALRHQRLQAQVGRDDVTGLPGRDRALEDLARAVAAARRHGRPIAALLVDLDGFAALGREHARAQTEAVLREVALRLSATLRAGDIAARMGADLFLIVLTDAPADQVALIGDRLRRSIESSPFRPDDVTVAVTASVGWAPWQGEEPELLLGRADEALLAAKAAGGNAVHPLA